MFEPRSSFVLFSRVGAGADVCIWVLIVVAAHVRSRDDVAYFADLEQMWVEIPSENAAATMLDDLSHASFCLLCIGAILPRDSMQRYTMTSSMDM
jgi:hypothetical protein